MSAPSKSHTGFRSSDSLKRELSAPRCAQELLRMVSVRDGGQTIQLPAIRAIARQAICDAIAGKSFDLVRVIRLARIIDMDISQTEETFSLLSKRYAQG